MRGLFGEEIFRGFLWENVVGEFPEEECPEEYCGVSLEEIFRGFLLFMSRENQSIIWDSIQDYKYLGVATLITAI